MPKRLDSNRPHSKADIISLSNSDQRHSSKAMVISLKDLSSSHSSSNQLMLGKVCRQVMHWLDETIPF